MLTLLYKNKYAPLIFIGLLSLCTTQPALAVGTASGIDISNQATLDYEVDSVNQTDISSNTVTFRVDAKVDLTVTGTGDVNGTPGTINVLEFTVTNTGNETYDYALSFEAGAETFTVSDFAIHVDTNNSGAWDGVTTDLPSTLINNLVAGATTKAWLVGTIPAAAIDNQTSTYRLKALALLEDGTAIPAQAVDVATTKQYVYADAAGPYTNDNTRDIQHSAELDLIAQTANLTITKSSAIVWDSVNLELNSLPFPGGIIEYTIQITNGAGAETASTIVITDILDTNLVVPTDPARQYALGRSIQVTSPNLYSGVTTALTDASDADEGTIVGQTVTVTGIVLLGGESATVTILAEIQ